jgi:hypothetical protein
MSEQFDISEKAASTQEQLKNGDPVELSIIFALVYRWFVDGIISGQVPGTLTEDPETGVKKFRPLLPPEELRDLRIAHSKPFPVKAEIPLGLYDFLTQFGLINANQD